MVSYAVMWIHIDRIRIRIHKIWWIRIQIRIQYNKITKSISNHLLKVKKKNYFQSVNKSISYFLGTDLKNMSYENKLLVKLCFSLHFYLWILIRNAVHDN